MSDPQLWESAFWGLAGGVVFQGLGSAYNQRQLKRANKKAAKEREENSKTGEKIESSKWFELEELPEIKSARAAVQKRVSRVEDMTRKISDINKGINIFGKRDETTKELPNFEGSEDAIALQQERARTSVIDQFVADITTDAIHSGTYDLLKEYLSSPEMTRAMAEKFNLSESEATRFVNDIVNKAERVKKEYNKQIDHITNQVAAINADSKNKDTVPLPYIQILAKQNLDRVLTGENLTDQGNIIQEQINALRSNPALDGILDNSINYEDVMTIGSITSSYVNFEAQKKAIRADNEINPLTKLIQIDAINKKQTILLRQLESITSINGKKSSPLGRILYTLRSAYGLKYNERGVLVEDKDAIEKTDKEILKDAGYIVTESEAEDAAKSFNEYTDTLSAFDNLVALSKKEINEADKTGKQLKEISEQLYNRYKQIADIRIGKLLNAADIATTKTQIAEQIDIIHNQNNINRQNMIKKAEEKILDLYTRYDRSVIDNLMSLALDGHQEQAKALAEQQLKDKEDDGIMFGDAFDILNLNSDNNIQLASYIKRLIDGKEWIEHIQKLQNEQGEKSTTSEEQISEEETDEQDSSSTEEEETGGEEGNALNEDKKGKDKRSKNGNQIIPDGANRIDQRSALAKRGVYSVIWNNGNAEYYDSDGVRIGNGSMTAEEYEKLTKKKATNSSTGGLDSNPTLAALKDSLDKNFDYLEVKGEDDIETNKDFDVDEAVNKVREKGLVFIDSLTVIDGVTITDEAKNELKAILDDRSEALRQRLTKFKEILNKKNPTMDEAATELAMASKIGISDNETQLPNIFIVGFENFIDAYAKISITPIKDGKKVISVQEILDIVNSVVGDKTTANYLLNKLRIYLKSPEIASKYIVLDKDTLDKEFNAQNANKDNEEIDEQREQFRVNIIDYVDFYSSDTSNATSKKEFFDTLNKLRKGDIIDLVVDGNVLYVKVGNVIIGSITKAEFENNTFSKINKGWVEDVAVNAGGDIISSTMDVYKRILTSDEPAFIQLRGVIIDAIVNGEVTDKNINDFINSDFIQAAINVGDDTLIAEGGENIEKRAKSMIEHLVRIYNYSTQGVVFTSKKDKIDNINYAIENYFASIYSDYDTINRINKDTKIKVEYINDGQVNTKFESGTNHHEDLPFISKDILKSKGKLGIFSQSDTTGTIISGEQKGPIPPNPPEVLKVLAIYDRNDAMSYVTVKQLLASDYNANPGYQKIFALASKELRNLLETATSDNTEASYNALAAAINNLVYNKQNAEGNIPLFVGLPHQSFNFKLDRRKGQINLYIYRNGVSESINIYRNSKGFRYTHDVNNKPTKEIKEDNSNFEEEVVRDIMTFIKNNSTVNIDINGIASDNNPSKNITTGFVHRVNGKIKFFRETYDSYNDFIINNGLARVNLNEPENDSNFVPRGADQRLNQVMYVTVNTTRPVEESIDTTKYNVEKPTNKTTDEEIFNKVHEAFENTSTSGKDLFIAAYGEEAYNDMLNVAGEFDIMEAILPLSIIYNPNLNSAENSTLEAKTNPTNHTIRVNVGSKTTPSGRTRVELAPGQVMVGDKFISMLSNIRGPMRNRAIAVMIHERLHWLIENNPNYTRKEILDAIAPIYKNFFELCQSYLDNYSENGITSEEELKRVRRRKAIASKAINDFKRYNNTRTYPDPLTKFDEFLVESITNIDYNELMNYFDATEQVEEGKKNIFTKLLEFVMKYLFNRTVRDGSLLKQEFNILSRLVNNQAVTIPNEQKTTATLPAAPGREGVRRIVTRINRPAQRTSNDMFADDEDEDSSIGILNNYNSESITGFLSTLPIEQRVKFQPMVDNGRLEYKCVIK